MSHVGTDRHRHAADRVGGHRAGPARGGIGVLAGDQLGQNREGDLVRGARADIQAGRRVQLGGELGLNLERRPDGLAPTGLATAPRRARPCSTRPQRAFLLASVRRDDERADAGEILDLVGGQRTTA